MNPENNMGNSFGNDQMGYSSLGSMPVNNEPNINASQGVYPSNDINDGMTLNSAINNYNQAPVSEPVNPEVTAQPSVNNNVEPNVYNPSYNSVGSYANSYSEQPTPTLNQGLNDYATSQAQSVSTVESLDEPVATPAVNDMATSTVGPTMPIPDQMPDVSYQANVSTPVDYATPVSDFDEIGVTPELDPKAKQKGGKKKPSILTFLLILVLIAGLGYGAYYLINVKGIFNKSSVTTKDLTFEQGNILSEDINEYATFTNISSSNCVLDNKSVDIFTAGTYEYTITCGKDIYRGKITINDTKAPEVVVATNVVSLENINNVEIESFIKSCSETVCTYAYDGYESLSSIVDGKGIYPIKIKVSDESGNAASVIAPLIVIDESLHLGLIAKKDISTSDEYQIVEKNVVLYSDTTSLTYTMYEFKFTDDMIYSTYANQTFEDNMLTIGDYKGYPMFNASNKTISLVTNNVNNLVQGSYAYDRQALLNVGYNTDVFASDHVSVIDE